MMNGLHELNTLARMVANGDAGIRVAAQCSTRANVRLMRVSYMSILRQIGCVIATLFKFNSGLVRSAHNRAGAPTDLN